MQKEQYASANDRYSLSRRTDSHNFAFICAIKKGCYITNLYLTFSTSDGRIMGQYAA